MFGFVRLMYTARNRSVKIVEVGARDGLQNEQFFVPTTVKQTLIKMLYDSGLRNIEATSFVSPKWVPQMADSRDLLKGLEELQSDCSLPVLVPNGKGLEDAIAAGARDIAVFTAASETFCQRNINCGMEESLRRIQKVIQKALKQGTIRSIRGYVSCAIGCPFEGWTDPVKVSYMTLSLLNMGCSEVSLGDTIGVGTANHMRRLLTKMEKIEPSKLAVHCHDTYGQALANILVAVEEYGIGSIDSSIAGLGGCPFAPGATGNVATEDVVYMLNGLKYETGVNIFKLVEAGNYICSSVNRKIESRAGNAILRSKSPVLLN